MGRELKRVDLGFSWPLRKVWKGYINPHPGPKNCTACDGTGQNDATREISDLWYDFEGEGTRWNWVDDPDGRRRRSVGAEYPWSHHLTQDEVDALVSAGRLMDLTHTWAPGEGWKRDPLKPHPTAEQVNEWSYSGGFSGHDAINHWICVETRAKRLGVWGKCATCRGRGYLKLARKAKKRHTTWKKFEPPTGTGYQVWETVSEGSPVTPVFGHPDDLIGWLVEWEGYSRDAATNFVKGRGWTMSGMSTGGKFYKDIEICSDAAFGSGV